MDRSDITILLIFNRATTPFAYCYENTPITNLQAVYFVALKDKKDNNV